jgi:hypothetical protein
VRLRHLYRLEYSVVKDLRDPFGIWAHDGCNERSSFVVVRSSFCNNKRSFTPAAVPFVRFTQPLAGPSSTDLEGPLYPSD